MSDNLEIGFPLAYVEGQYARLSFTEEEKSKIKLTPYYPNVEYNYIKNERQYFTRVPSMCINRFLAGYYLNGSILDKSEFSVTGFNPATGFCEYFLKRNESYDALL